MDFSKSVVSIERVCLLIEIVRSRKVVDNRRGSAFHLSMPKVFIELINELCVLSSSILIVDVGTQIMKQSSIYLLEKDICGNIGMVCIS